MRLSRLFGKTLRDDPAEAELVSHRLMLKAGMIYQAASGGVLLPAACAPVAP